MNRPSDPAGIRKAIWTELTAAVTDRGHPWRNVVLATSSSDNAAAVRMVILREAQAEQWQLVFYTDQRSAKCQQIKTLPKGELLFWHPVLKWQLRAAVDYQLLTEGPVIDNLWQQIAATPAANDYLAAAAPGDSLLSDAVAISETPSFAVIIATVRYFDWLALSKSVHKRAVLSADDFQWCAP